MTTPPQTQTPAGMSAYITIKGAAEAIAFYENAFGAREEFRLTDPSDGRIGHAQIILEGTTLMIADEYPEADALAPASIGGNPVKLHLYVADVDALFARAVAAGATQIQAISDQFHGDRSGTVKDPFGYTWILATRTKNISPEKMQAEWNAAMAR